MRRTGSGLRPTIFVGESNTWQHKSVAGEIVRRALDGVVSEGLVLLDECEVIRYAGRST